RLGDLGVREADDVSEEKRHLQIRVERLDRPPDGVDRLRALGRSVDDLERRDGLDVHDGAWAALQRAQLVEGPVLRHLEEPGGEAGAEREAREALVDPEEDLLSQILRERPVAGEPEDVVEDRLLVRPDDDRERALVTPLCLSQDSQIGLWQRHGRGEYRAESVRGLWAGV